MTQDKIINEIIATLNNLTMKTLVSVVCFIPFIIACQSKNEAYQLSHSPTDEVTVKISDATIIVDFSLDENMGGVINNETVQKEINTIETREELISYYKSLPPYFQPGYSSLFTFDEYKFASVEYLLAQECFQDHCSSQTRKEVLKIAVDKQKHKFGVEYTSPSFTRRTGTFLIAIILLKEGDNSFIQSLKSNVDLQKTLLCMNNNIWMSEEEFNNLLIQYAETFLSK